MYHFNPLLEFFNGDADLDISTIDKEKVDYLRKNHLDLIKKLDTWVLIPDFKLLPYIKKLSQIIDSMYHFKPCNIYRGFGVHGCQNTADLVDKSWFFNKLKKEVKIGYKFNFNVTQPISFSTRFKIASDFGKVVIQSTLPKTNKLVITPELYVLISELRHLKILKTQHEVIILPDNQLKCKVIKI